MAKGSIVDVVNAFYDTWKLGMASLDEGRIRELVDPDIEFEGPLAGKLNGAEAYVGGLLRFVRTVKAQRIRQIVDSGNDAAVLYECDLAMPEGTFQFAEFLRIENGRITRDTLVFDTAEFRKLGPPTDRN